MTIYDDIAAWDQLAAPPRPAEGPTSPASSPPASNSRPSEPDLSMSVPSESSTASEPSDLSDHNIRQVGRVPLVTTNGTSQGLRRSKIQPRRGKRITVDVSDEELAQIDRRRHSLSGAPMSRSAWLVQQATRDDLSAYTSEQAERRAEQMMLRRALEDAFNECNREKRDLVGIATNLNQATRVANSEGTVGRVAELIPGIYRLRDDLTVRARRIDELIDRLDRAPL